MRRYREAFSDAVRAFRTSIRKQDGTSSAAFSDSPDGNQDSVVDDEALLRSEIAAGRWGVQSETGTGWPRDDLSHFVPHDAARQQAMLDLNINAGTGSVGKMRAAGQSAH